MKADKQRNYSASYGYTGRDKRQGHRGAEVKGGPGRTFSNTVLTERMCVTGDVKERACEWMLQCLKLSAGLLY